MVDESHKENIFQKKYILISFNLTFDGERLILSNILSFKYIYSFFMNNVL